MDTLQMDLLYIRMPGLQKLAFQDFAMMYRNALPIGS
jgi:hypothetical protein